MYNIEDFIVDEVFGERLLISKLADKSELDENIRVARVLLNCFDDMNIRINEHLLVLAIRTPNILSMRNLVTEKAWKVKTELNQPSVKPKNKVV